MPDGEVVSEDAHGSRREAIWHGFASGGMAILLFPAVQLFRSMTVRGFQTTFLWKVPPGLIPLSGPTEPSHLELGLLYRVMHNLTVPYVMPLYVLAFVAAFFLFGRRERSRRARRIFAFGSVSVHLVFVALCWAAVFTPEDDFGGLLSFHFTPSRLEPQLEKVPEDVEAFISKEDRFHPADLRRIAEVPDGGARAVVDFLKDGSEDGDHQAIASEALLFASDDPYPILIEASRSPEVVARGFGAEVMGLLADERYLPRLEELRSDSTKLYQWNGRETVGEVAERAIAIIRRYRDNPLEWQRHVRRQAAWTRTGKIH